MNDAGDLHLGDRGFFSVTEATFSAAPVAIGLYTGDGRCIFANDAYAALTGATKASLLTQNFHDITSWQNSGLLAAALRTLASGEPERLEISVVSSFGREIWARAEFGRISRGAEPLLLFICNDLTDLKVRERELVEALRVARESNEAQSRFLASVSHELRTPLNAILGFSEILSSSGLVEAHPSRITEYAQDIHLSAKYLLSLIDDLLDLARLEHGSYHLENEPFDVAAVIRRALTLCRHVAEAKEITVIANVAEATHFALGDPRLSQQSLVNLLSNAVKFTGRDGQITIDLRRSGAMICVTVTDTGVGIPAAELPYLGQPFRRADHGRGKTFAGTGLGLAITKAVMERQGGQLVLESVEGVGTVARLLLPAHDANGRAK